MKKFQSRSFMKSASHALDGLFLAFRSERNFRKHLYIGAVVLLIAVLLKVSVIAFCILLLTNALVLILELLNSVFEFVLDAYYRNKYSKLVKFAKDMGAASVLIMSCVSMIIACFILGDRIYQYHIGNFASLPLSNLIFAI